MTGSTPSTWKIGSGPARRGARRPASEHLRHRLPHPVRRRHPPRFNARGVSVLDYDGAIREWVGVCLPITGSKRFQVDRSSADDGDGRLTTAQARGARAMLGWIIVRLSEAADLSLSTVARIEDEARIGSVRQSMAAAARQAFERNGVVFTWTMASLGGLYLRDR